jgi:hypothetical protein
MGFLRLLPDITLNFLIDWSWPGSDNVILLAENRTSE